MFGAKFEKWEIALRVIWVGADLEQWRRLAANIGDEQIATSLSAWGRTSVSVFSVAVAS
jgi:hypothetical protein